jgi:DNA polymerase III epsilon subunit-like protein
MIDAASRKLVCEPLKRGGRHCLFHACMFCVKPAVLGDAIIVFLDLETTGLSVLSDHIVEIGCVDAKGLVFTTVVNPLVMSSGPAVHGISDTELMKGPTFNVAFSRFVYFLESLVDNAFSTDDEDSSIELPDQPTLPHVKAESPEVVVVAHNGIKFDFPFLLSECYRARMSLDFFAKLKYVDTLSIVRAIDGQLYGGCMKLQCMLLHLSEHGEGTTSLRAHRALDDAIVLKDVVNNIAHRLGVSTNSLLSVFSHELDLGASVAHLSPIV